MLTQHPTPDTPAFPAVLLRHDVLAPARNTPVSPNGSAATHYDWMLADPVFFMDSAHPPSPDERSLWTARVSIPSTRWRENPFFDVEPIANHRGRFLVFEGRLAGDRGSVTRVDEGQFNVLKWAPQLIEVSLAFREVQGLLRMAPIDKSIWRATWL